MIRPRVSMETWGAVEVAVFRAIGASVEHAEVDEHVLVGEGDAEVRGFYGAEDGLDLAFNVGHWIVSAVSAP